jgi:carbonic anhydrase
MKSRLLLVVMIIGVFYVDHAAASEASAFTADRAMELLREGNARYVNADPAHPNCGGERRSETASEGQHPFVAVLSCSDSRVPVELVFDRGIGDIFVIRVAGNIAIDRGVIGSAEYAAGHLGVPLLVVMGHTGCGAVKAAISGTPLAGDI